MGVNIMQVGITGLQAAQIGIATAGQNITNSSTPGYSTETAQQAAAPAQGYSFGYVGQGVQVTTITREYNQLLATQINTTQSAASQISSYASQITPIDNTIANPSAGLSPVMQSFFSSLQNLSANPAGIASLQTAMSSAQTLVAQFQTLQSQLSQSSSSVNQQITSTVNSINIQARQLAAVNQAIQVGYSSANNQPPNSLLDQRDQLVNALSKETQVTVVPQGNQYNVFIGNGQPLVAGAVANTLTTVQSATNPNNLDVAYTANGVTSPIGEGSLPGGSLGGLFAFRTNSLSPIQNQIGQIAIVMASNINAQNELGQTISGKMGTALFTIATPQINPNANNTGSAQLSASITNPAALTADNYTLSYDGSNYKITDNSTNTVKSTFAAFPATPTAGVNVIDGVTYTLGSGTMKAGDSFAVSPTANGVIGLAMATTDPTQIAPAAPIATSTPTTNTGTGAITPGVVNTGFTPANSTPATTLSYAAGSNSLSGFPVGSTVVTVANGVTTTYNNYAAGTAIPFTAGMSMTFNNMTLGLSGTPGNGDTFTVGPNTNATGDNRNVLLMNKLSTQNTMSGGTATYQGVYAQMVDAVGNTTSQLNTTGTTETNLLQSATAQQQSISGVNVDQETVNLLQFQQTYQACGKLIQIATQNFSTVLGLDGSG